MGIATKLKDFLDKEHISYQTMMHPEAFTATEIAACKHVPGKQFAKCVIINADGEYIMCVMPATHHIDFTKLKKLVDARDLRLASEDEIRKLFPEFPPGTEPPFGELYSLKIDVYADQILEENEEIVLSAGTHTDLVKIRWMDFMRLVRPIMGDIGKHV